jgi:hypothetical protein
VNAATYPVPQIDVSQIQRDPFEGCEDASKVFHGVADYLAIWCNLYGLREDQIVAEHFGWLSESILTFRIRDRRGIPVSPLRYDTRLPDQPKIFWRRAFWIRRFVSRCRWFRKAVYEADARIRAWLADHGLTYPDVEIVSRWSLTGHVVLKIVEKSTAGNPRRYQTHLRHEL